MQVDHAMLFHTIDIDFHLFTHYHPTVFKQFWVLVDQFDWSWADSWIISNDLLSFTYWLGDCHYSRTSYTPAALWYPRPTCHLWILGTMPLGSWVCCTSLSSLSSSGASAPRSWAWTGEVWTGSSACWTCWSQLGVREWCSSCKWCPCTLCMPSLTFLHITYIFID